MPRPFAYNPQTSPGDLIPGTIQYQDLAIGVDEQDYSKQPGGVVWWMGPDESNYIIAGPVPEGNHPTPVGNVGTVRFVKTADNSPAAFLMAVWQLSETHFPTVVQGYQWLVDNGFWTTFEPDRINIYTSGDFSILANPLRPSGARLLGNGEYDLTFNLRDGFEVIVPDGYDDVIPSQVNITSIVELDDNTLLYFGDEAMGYNGIRYSCVVNLNRSGGIANGFVGGFASVDGLRVSISGVNYAKKLSDGKILAVGNFATYNGEFQIGICKFNQDGSRDLNFNTPEVSGQIYHFTELSDGNIILVGSIRGQSGSGSQGVIKISANGIVDNSFSVGVSGLNIYQDGYPRRAIQAGTKLFIIGDFSSVNSIQKTEGIFRMDINGGIDNSHTTMRGFVGGFGARYPIAGVDGGDGVILISNELAFSAFNFQTINYPVVKIKYSDGTLDTTFSNNVKTIVDNYAFGPKFITLTPDGTKFLLGGNSAMPFVRINLNGTEDTSFNAGVGFDKHLWYAQQLTDGKVYTYTDEPARYNTQPVNQFGVVDGAGAKMLTFTTEGFTNGGYAKNIVRALDGDIIAVGSFSEYNNQTRNGIVKFEVDGTISSYAANTGAKTGANAPATVSDIALQSNGQAVIVGPFDLFDNTTRLGMARLTSSGNIDNFFYSYQAGMSYNYRFSTGSTFSQVSSYPTCVKVDANDKVLVGGAFTNWNNQIDQFKYIMRFNSDGSRDTGWTYPQYLTGAVKDIEIQSTGKIIAVGDFSQYGSTVTRGIIRFGTTGVMDTTFNAGNLGFNLGASVSKIFIMTDNSMFISGTFTSYNGVSANRIIKLTPDGAIDTSFVYGTGFNGVVEDIQLTIEDELIMAGAFTTYNGVAVDNRMLRLSLTGEVISTFETQSATNGTIYSILYRDPFE